MSRTGLLSLLAVLAALPITAAVENANVVGPEQAPLVRENVPLAVVITVRNPNDRAVRVRKIDSSCTCTTLHLADHFLLPKATTTLTVSVDNANRSGPQHQNISIYLTDPAFDAIEAHLWWQVRGNVQVDLLSAQMDPLQRPTDRAWQDIYRYSTKARPDEPQRLSKRIRLSCPPEEAPPGGLRVIGIDYPGTIWGFTHVTQSDGSILLTAAARDPAQPPDEGLRHEKVVVRTNHPDKPAITLEFVTLIAKNAGQVALDPNVPPPAALQKE